MGPECTWELFTIIRIALSGTLLLWYVVLHLTISKKKESCISAYLRLSWLHKGTGKVLLVGPLSGFRGCQSGVINDAWGFMTMVHPRNPSKDKRTLNPKPSTGLKIKMASIFKQGICAQSLLCFSVGFSVRASRLRVEGFGFLVL